MHIGIYNFYKPYKKEVAQVNYPIFSENKIKKKDLNFFL
jgi:hypothetical protein